MGILSYLREHSYQEMLSRPILPSKKLLYQLYYTILQHIQHPNFFFFSILFKYSILFLFFFFFNYLSFLFLFLSLSLNLKHRFKHIEPHTQRPMIHRSTYPNPAPHTESHTYRNTSHQTIN